MNLITIYPLPTMASPNNIYKQAFNTTSFHFLWISFPKRNFFWPKTMFSHKFSILKKIFVKILRFFFFLFFEGGKRGENFITFQFIVINFKWKNILGNVWVVIGFEVIGFWTKSFESGVVSLGKGCLWGHQGPLGCPTTINILGYTLALHLRNNRWKDQLRTKLSRHTFSFEQNKQMF